MNTERGGKLKEEKKKYRLRNSDKGRIEAKDIGAADSGTKKWWQYNALWGIYCRFPKDPKILLPWCASLSLSLSVLLPMFVLHETFGGVGE